MATVEQVNSVLDKIVSAGEYLALLIPGKVDDLLFSVAKWARSDATIQSWLATALEPDPNSLTELPPVLVEAARRFEEETGEPAVPGKRIQAILALLQILAEIRKFFPAS
jgi:hypothetical protein